MKKLLILPLIIVCIALLIGYFLSKTEKNKIHTLKPFEQLHFMRNYPDFESGSAAYLTAMKKEAGRIMNHPSQKNETSPVWKTQGPYNIGGRINTIAHNPGNDQTIYVGSVCGGIFKTIDGGENWFPIFDNQAYLSISHIVVSPHDTNTLYVGTGDPNISGYPWVGNGIYKSTDAGITWEHLGLENTGIVTKIAVNTNNPSIIYAATMGLPFVRNSSRGLYKTSNGGQSWEQILFLSNEAGIIDLVLLPNTPDTIFAAGWTRIRNYNESLSAGPESKIYRSFDGGITWDTLTKELPIENMSRIGLSFSIDDSIQIIAQFVEPTTYETEGIYRTQDFGESWERMAANGIEDGILGGFGWYFGKIRINPYNKNQLFILGVDLYRSEDGGEIFELTTPEWYTYEVHADKHDLVFIDENTLLLATDGGLYKSADGGHNWSDVENIPNTQMYRIAVDPHNAGFYCGGAQDNGTNYGNFQDSANWKRLFGGDGFQPLFDHTNPDLIYAETQNGGLYVGIKSGAEYDWNYFNIGIDKNDRRSWDMPICQSKTNPQIMYTGTYRMYQIDDAPDGTWKPISEDLTDGTNSGYHIISAVEVSPFNSHFVMSGSSDGFVYVFDSINWINISNGLPQRYVTCVRFSPNIPENLFVSHSGYKANENIPHIHFSSNLGNSWNNISGNLPQLAINSFVVIPGYGDSVIFAATDGGIYHTVNLGNRWERTGTGMPVFPVYDLVYDDSNHVLVAGTFARSIMTLELTPIIKKYEAPNAIKEANNSISIYPNPAVEFIKINIDNRKQKAEILVSNYMGATVLKTLLTENETQLDISHLKPGVYVISVISNNQLIDAQKISIIR